MITVACPCCGKECRFDEWTGGLNLEICQHCDRCFGFYVEAVPHVYGVFAHNAVKECLCPECGFDCKIFIEPGVLTSYRTCPNCGKAVELQPIRFTPEEVQI